MLMAALPALLLAGCVTAADDGYPSLSIRDYERGNSGQAGGGQIDSITVEPSQPPAPLMPAMAATLESLRTAAFADHRAFMAQVPKTRQAVSAARGASVGSKSWGNAQVALASLESARSETAVPLGDLDELYVDAATTNGPVAAVAAVRIEVQALMAEEDAILGSLRLSAR